MQATDHHTVAIGIQCGKSEAQIAPCTGERVKAYNAQMLDSRLGALLQRPHLRAHRLNLLRRVFYTAEVRIEDLLQIAAVRA